MMIQGITGIRIVAAAGLLLLTVGAHAGLMAYQANGVDLVYDDDYTPTGASAPGLTWTADANLAASETFGVTGIDANGIMTWDKALEWIDAMNMANYAGVNDWRLWSALNRNGSGPCSEFDCTDSELGHLFYIEGGLSASDMITSSTVLTDVFTNMQDNVYWSDTEFFVSDAWYFGTDVGDQSNFSKGNQVYVWAVRPGQVAAAPLPGTAMLMALGLLGLGAGRMGRLWP
jgi:hypothetical protein